MARKLIRQIRKLVRQLTHDHNTWVESKAIGKLLVGFSSLEEVHSTVSSGDATCAASEARKRCSCTARCKSQVPAEQRKRLCNHFTSTCKSAWKGSAACKSTYMTVVVAVQMFLLSTTDLSSQIVGTTDAVCTS